MKFIFSALLCSLFAPAFGLEEWVFGSIDATLPKAMSDHTAARSPGNGLIYIGGGCGKSDVHAFALKLIFFDVLRFLAFVNRRRGWQCLERRR
jgi:hypothetical protein